MGQIMRLIKHIAAIALVLGLSGMPVMAEIVVVVSAKSPVTALNKNQVVNIFLGKVNRFPDNTAAMPIDQVEGSAVRDEFYATIVGKSAAQIKAHWSKIIFTGRGQPPAEVSSNSEVKKRIAGNPAAIGYIDKSALDNSVKALTISP